MLGRAVQLTLPAQSPGEEEVTDSMPAKYYLVKALRGHSLGELAQIRQANTNATYLWGDLLSSCAAPTQAAVDTVRLLNLETAVTRTISNSDVPRYKITYHLHSDNLPRVLSALRSPRERLVVVVANNHAMDFGRQAFEEETLPLLDSLSDGCQFAGAGRSLQEAMQAVDTPLAQANVVLRTVAVSTHCSGTMTDWGATRDEPGLLVAPSVISSAAVAAAFRLIQGAFEAESKVGKGMDEVRLVSIHWGPNWAYRSESDSGHQKYRAMLAHRLIDELDVDVIYGHSSHHIRGIEVYRGKLILYGAGDFVNDYGGFANPGDEDYCMLGALFEVELGDGRQLLRLLATPTFVDRLRLRRLTRDSHVWSAAAGALEPRPQGAEELAKHVNGLSRQDCGEGGRPVSLRVAESEEGPLLVYP